MAAGVKLVDGRALAARWTDDIAVQVAALGVPLGLAAVCAEGDAALAAFVRLKERAAQKAGIQFSSYFFDPRDPAGAEDTMRFLAADESVQGMFVELPLPRDWNTEVLLGLIPPEKDVDALTSHPQVPAPAVRALAYVLEEYAIDVHGMHAAVIGNGRLIGRPVAGWLRERGADVTVIDIDTSEPAAQAARADLVVTGVGEPGLVTADWVKEGAAVIDFGYSEGTGDVAEDSVKQKAGILSPVPGGMGPLVIAAVLENLLTLATR
ncbi:MAG TPA: bifunctional 5,10-methylenetetrahydrofolate dehydrogenase/5,10-methenyltetrahydrofolate cyclohydrolase [Candidatus Paceibacterota bacterium]|nr:bifunctional 5,10-methylenetetrahydrofolate dehydrogenase/5,10-methenyltetrahydrofolate cyclohydrolase [Candidatus Paceibacterota bacterium]